MGKQLRFVSGREEKGMRGHWDKHGWGVGWGVIK